jgi:hypothetical protein
MLYELALILIVICLGSVVWFLWERALWAALLVMAAGVWLIIRLQDLWHIDTRYPMDLTFLF